MSQLTDKNQLPDDPPTKRASAVFGFEEFWPKVYEKYGPQFDAVNDLICVGDEMVKAAGEAAYEPVHKVICALTLATVTAAQEVVVLCGNGCGAGAMKVVRGMYESRWTAEYMRRHPDEVDDYLEFWKILAWRRLHWLQENAPSEASRIPANAVKQVENDYNRAKSSFTDGNGRVRFQWSAKSIRKMAKEVGREKEYELPYTLACSIHHCNFEGLSAHFALRDGAPMPDPPPSLALLQQSLILAHANLLFALSTLNDKCGLGFTERLSAAGRTFSQQPGNGGPTQATDYETNGGTGDEHGRTHHAARKTRAG